jgi:hypothetical protein
MLSMERKTLPGIYEKRYKSEHLKSLIADDGMWYLIPAVSGGMNSPAGIQRLKENDLLFTFIDQYFPDDPFAFEPIMQDGRFVFMPQYVDHQGIGVCVSKDMPGFLEVCQFWYPREYTEKPIEGDQLYVPVFALEPCPELASMIREVYMYKKIPHQPFCTFPLYLNLVVTLKGNFLDKMNQTAKTIRAAVKDSHPQVQKIGEDMIAYMMDLVSERPLPPPIHSSFPQ